MKLFHYRGPQQNFGDELNLWLWPRIFGEIFDDDDSEIFIGIGSTIYGDHFPARAQKIVFGAGYGSFGPPPDVQDGSFTIYFVRGPRTAAALGLDRSMAITDGAVLLRTQQIPLPSSPRVISFMPHYQSLQRGHWAEVCAAAGITLIDPTDEVDVVLERVLRSRLLITEALHGAVVADTLRVPWIPVVPIDAQQRFKWLDWTDSLGLAYRPAHLFPSGAREALTLATRRSLIGNGRSPLGNRVAPLFDSAALRLFDRPFIQAAAHRLTRIATTEPVLSRDTVVDTLTDRVLEKIARFQRTLPDPSRARI